MRRERNEHKRGEDQRREREEERQRHREKGSGGRERWGYCSGGKRERWKKRGRIVRVERGAGGERELEGKRE